MAKPQENLPPKLRKAPDGTVEAASLADLLEFFLNNDSRVSIVRHPQVEELFQWKQVNDAERGIEVFPFENAEARFAIGAFQAVNENNSEDTLGRWITDVLQVLGEAKETNEDIARDYKLDTSRSHVEESAKIPNVSERRIYLTSCWFEALCTAEVRFLGWVYQELYGKPFQPLTVEN